MFFVEYFPNYHLKSKNIDNIYFIALDFKFIRFEEREDRWKAVLLLNQGIWKSFAKTVGTLTMFSATHHQIAWLNRETARPLNYFLWLLITHFCAELSRNNDPG